MAVAAVVVAGISYQSHSAGLRQPSEARASSLTASQQAPFDVEAVIRQVHFAYRPEQDGWRGGHSTYDVRATAQGLTLTPVHFKKAESETLEPSEPETGASLFLGMARVARGDTLLSGEAPRGKVEADGHLAFQQGALVEHLRNSEQGVEQSWSFEQAPSGKGDLRVSIPVKGLVHTRTSEQGLHFADAKTGLGFRYGHGTWVDGQGRRTPVRAEYSDGQIQLRVPEEVLAASTYPAVLDPVVSYEMIVDGRLVAADTAVRANPALAFNGTNYFVVWRDTRSTQYNIYGTRVSSLGTVLDPSGIAVSTGSGNSVDPQVATNGTDFYVVWSQFSTDDWAIRGSRVTSGGVVSDPGGRPLSDGTGTQNSPHVASNGTDYLVTWYMRADDGYYNIYARRVSSAGQLMDPSDLSIATGSNYDETTSVVASNGSVYLVAWSDERSGTSQAYARLVSNEGALLGTTDFPLAGGSSAPQYVQAIASNGQGFLVVWLDYRNVGTRDLYGTRVTGSGNVVDGTGLLVSSSPTISESYASVGSDGTDYLVAWTAWTTSNSTFQSLASRVSASAASASAVLDKTSLVLSPNAGHKHPAVARANSGYLVTWDGTTGATTNLYNAWVSSAGMVSSGNGISLTPVTSLFQTEPVIASNGRNYLVVWTETDGNSVRIQGTRVSKWGGVIDMPGLQLTTALRERQSPAVTSNGTDYFVTWMDYRNVNWDIYGTRVLGTTGSGSNAVVDPNGIAISTTSALENFPAVGSNGTDYLVVWRQDVGDRGDLYGARVTSEGVVQDPSGIAISTTVAEHYTPRVAFNGSNYFVVWAELLSSTSWDIHGARVTTTGTVLDPSGIVISNLDREQNAPDVASNGTDFFVVWADNRSGSNNDIYGARVSSEGVVQDPNGIAICTETVHQASPRVVFDETNYVAAWADYRWDSYWDVYATQVTSSGTVLTPNGFLVVDDVRESEPAVSLASMGGQKSFVVYSRYDTEPNQGSRRVRGAFFSF